MEINKTIIILSYLGVMSIIITITEEIFNWYYSKKCNYDCSKCKKWDCRFHRCNYLKNKKENNK